MSKTYYYEPLEASPEIISDWDSYDEDSWADIRYINFFGTNHFLVPNRSKDTISFVIDLNEPFTVQHTYKPLWKDPGDHVEDVFRYDWMQTQYAPGVELQGTFLPERNCSVICSTFLDTSKDYIGHPSQDSDLFTGEFGKNDFAQLIDKSVRFHLDVSDDPVASLYLEGGEPAVLISLDQQSMLALLDQMESGDFESLYISLDVPGFRITTAPFSRFDSTWKDVDDVFLIPDLRSFRQETSTYMRLVKRVRTIKADPSEDKSLRASNLDTPISESKFLKYGGVVVLIIIALIAMG